MNPPAGITRRRVSGGWALPLGVLAGIAAAAFAGVLSKAVFADLLAWWPVWLLLAVLVPIARNRHVGPIRITGLIPFLALGATIVFLLGHLSGWPVMPSASSRLIGPPTADYQVAAMSARIPGGLEVGPATTGFLYTVESLRWGGQIANADASERVQGGAIGVDLSPGVDPGVYRFSGWQVGLSPGIPWSLALSGIIDADLSAITIKELQLGGEGRVALGSGAASSVTVTGDFDMALPPNAAVRVIGEATVPPGWQTTEDGAQSPVPGAGWIISVAPESSVRITTP